jgi:2'-5' RNA ligase
LAQIRIEPFILPLTGVGSYPTRGVSKVLWAGVGAGHSRLFQLRQRVDDTLLRLGWRGDLSTFEPHITLARLRDAPPAAITHWVRRHREYAGPSFPVKSFDLRSSELQPEGAEHTVLRVFPLGT